MIRFFLTRGHHYTLDHVVKSRVAPPVEWMSYDALFATRELSRATQIFSDLDRLGYWDLEVAADLYLQLKNAGHTVWNNPARFKNRHTLLRALHAAGLNDFDAYRPHELHTIKRFPVFLRKIQGHREPLGGLLNTPAETETAVAAAIASGTPEENLVIIECVAEPVRPGVFRKLSAFRIGHAIIPHISVHDTQWLVKYGQNFTTIEDLYQEENAILGQNPHAAHLQKVFDVAGIDYGRADFGFYRGRLQVFEINTNPDVAPEEPHPSATRITNMKVSWEKYLAALQANDSPAGPAARLATDKLPRHRRLRNLFTPNHTRVVP